MRTGILYEDDHIIVAYKPAGLAVQTAKVGQADMVSELKNHIKSSSLGIVHRLDQPVEGLLVFGRTRAATAELNRQLSQGTLNKQYYAAVCGNPGNQSGELVNYLRKTPDNRAEIVENSAKKAVLQYRILESRTVEDCCAEKDINILLADIHIDTGRFHQIRAQMAHAGMPLLGDAKYGSELSMRLSAELSVRSVALCAYELQFVHPADGRKLRFQTEPRGEVFRLFSQINIGK